ncbi:unnamed protein product [Closterium sp. NIES-65]|nr:unnamed protein product [Closterium sp. NIES-65]
MASIDDARTRCPEIVLVNGEDLTPYRQASKRIFFVLARFGTLERLGLDEAFVDLSPQVAAMVAAGSFKEGFLGHVERGAATGGGKGGGASEIDREGGRGSEENDHDDRCLFLGPGECHLAAGSWLAGEARRAVEEETGYQMSCGVSHNSAQITPGPALEEVTGYQMSCGVSRNKMLAKLVSSRHKPNDQTTLVASAAVDFISNLPVRKVPGVGRRLEEQLASRGVTVMKGLLAFTLQDLQMWLGPKLAPFLFGACRAYDPTPVTCKGPAKSVSVEDSFPPIHSLAQAKVAGIPEPTPLVACKDPAKRVIVENSFPSIHSLAQAKPIVHSLLPDLLTRIDEEWEETRRRPKTFTVKWRKREKEYRFTSASCPMPSQALSPSTPPALRVSSLLRLASSLLSRAFTSPSAAAATCSSSRTEASELPSLPAVASSTAAASCDARDSAFQVLPVLVINVGATNFLSSSPQQPECGQPGSAAAAGGLQRWLKKSHSTDIGNAGGGDLQQCLETHRTDTGRFNAGGLQRWLKSHSTDTGNAGSGGLQQGIKPHRTDTGSAGAEGQTALPLRRDAAAAGSMDRWVKPRGVGAGYFVQREREQRDGREEEDEMKGKNVVLGAEKRCSQVLPLRKAGSGYLDRWLGPRVGSRKMGEEEELVTQGGVAKADIVEVEERVRDGEGGKVRDADEDNYAQAEGVEEHRDYHFALRLEAEENGVAKSSKLDRPLKREMASAEGKHTQTMQTKRSKSERKFLGGPGKGKADRNATLDGFVSRQSVLK